jgi:hypothetical protein
MEGSSACAEQTREGSFDEPMVTASRRRFPLVSTRPDIEAFVDWFVDWWRRRGRHVDWRSAREGRLGSPKQKRQLLEDEQERLVIDDGSEGEADERRWRRRSVRDGRDLRSIPAFDTFGAITGRQRHERGPTQAETEAA